MAENQKKCVPILSLAAQTMELGASTELVRRSEGCGFSCYCDEGTLSEYRNTNIVLLLEVPWCSGSVQEFQVRIMNIPKISPSNNERGFK